MWINLRYDIFGVKIVITKILKYFPLAAVIGILIQIPFKSYKDQISKA